jgi:hypothetical protein
MPVLHGKVISLRPIVAETGPIGIGKPTPRPPAVPLVGAEFIANHKIFIDEVTALNHCFTRGEILSFPPEELEGHIQVALQDNFIIEDGRTGQFCTGQVAWRLKELTKGYVYERLS